MQYNIKLFYPKEEEFYYFTVMKRDKMYNFLDIGDTVYLNIKNKQYRGVIVHITKKKNYKGFYCKKVVYNAELSQSR